MALHFRLLTERDVRSVLTMPDLIETMASALARFSAGDAVQPVRSVLAVRGSDAFFGLMPAHLTQPAALGAKLVTVFARNAERNLPTHLATILLFDPATGALVAMMDGRYITEARTAAVSAVAVRHLARSNAPATLALIGSGVQARSHLDALAHACSLAAVKVWSPNATHVRAFAEEMSASVPVPIHPAPNAEWAVRDADLIVLVTSAAEPVIENPWVADGALVISVGACRPDQREMDPALTARGSLFVDSRAAALVESGDVVRGIAEGRFGPDHIRGELGDVLLGRVPGRTSAEEVTIFKSLGLAVEDITAADLAHRRAVERGVGSELTL